MQNNKNTADPLKNFFKTFNAPVSSLMKLLRVTLAPFHLFRTRVFSILVLTLFFIGQNLNAETASPTTPTGSNAESSNNTQAVAPLPALPFDYSLLANLPIQHEGRIKPLDTFARVNLLLLSGKRSLPDASAMEWLFELLLDPSKADTREVFAVPNPDVLEALNLAGKIKKRYSFSELIQVFEPMRQTLTEIAKKSRDERSLVQSQLLELDSKISVYWTLRASLTLLRPNFVMSNEALANKLGVKVGTTISYMQLKGLEFKIKDEVKPLLKKLETGMSGLDEYSKSIVLMVHYLTTNAQDEFSDLLRIIPSPWNEDNNQWFAPWTLISAGRGSPQSAQYFILLTNLSNAYLTKDVGSFNQIAKEITAYALQISRQQTNVRHLQLETFNNRSEPFTISLVFYFLGFFLLLASWMTGLPVLHLLSLIFAAIGFLAHTAGILSRMYIMGRPPVSTLYESILFVGFVAMLIALFFEQFRKEGMALFVGLFLGIVLHFVALGHSADGDSMGMLVAVLNTNFWLAVHVTTITIAYGTCLVGGLLGHIYLVLKIVKPEWKHHHAELYKNMMVISLAALLFAIFGTATGGIWADQSWGRFWGWDPKENGALLICLWLLWLLHGRIAEYFDAPGFAVGMVLTNVVVALAWFGVNLLNVGLHSYGFTSGIAIKLGTFVSLEILFALITYLFATQKLVWKSTN